MTSDLAIVLMIGIVFSVTSTVATVGACSHVVSEWSILANSERVHGAVLLLVLVVSTIALWGVTACAAVSGVHP